MGIPLDMFKAQGRGPVDAETAAMLQPMIDHLALTRAINEAWFMLAVLTALALLCLPLASRRPANAP